LKLVHLALRKAPALLGEPQVTLELRLFPLDLIGGWGGQDALLAEESERRPC
jgi:hypothetical protein